MHSDRIKEDEEVVTRQEEGKIVGDDPKEGNSASQQNQEDMDDKVKSAESEIDKEVNKQLDDLSDQLGSQNIEKRRNTLSRFLKKGYKEIMKNELEDEQKKKDKGDTGPAL